MRYLYVLIGLYINDSNYNCWLHYEDQVALF